MSKRSFQIYRYDPDQDARPRMQTIEVDLDGSVDQIAGKATMPAFSSDGRRLYVAYNRGGTWETWRATWTDGRVHLDEQLNLPIAFLYPHYGWSVAACADP